MHHRSDPNVSLASVEPKSGPIRSLNRRDFLLAGIPLLAGGCTTPSGGGSVTTQASVGKSRAKAEYERTFVASGAALRFPPHGAHGRPWTDKLQAGYDSFKLDPRAGYAVQNLRSGRYLAEHNADEIKFGGSMPKPALSAIVLDRYRGELSRENFMHIVKVCDRSINASWRALTKLFTLEDERRFFAKYGLPPSNIRSNSQSPRFYSEFFRLCVNYRLEYGNHLLVEAMRRAQFGRGRWYLPNTINYIGGKTGTYGQFKHEGLWFTHRGTPYSIVLYTKGHFGSGSNIWKMGAMFGGLFREHIA